MVLDGESCHGKGKDMVGCAGWGCSWDLRVARGLAAKVTLEQKAGRGEEATAGAWGPWSGTKGTRREALGMRWQEIMPVCGGAARMLAATLREVEASVGFEQGQTRSNAF